MKKKAVAKKGVKKTSKKRKVKLGLALGGGSAKGFAHIGVLKVLDKAGIVPDYVAGTSMGAAMGASYCAGMPPKELERIVTTVNWPGLVDFTLPWSGVIKGNKIEGQLRRIVYGKSFEELDIPFSCVSYNITKHQREIFSAGNLVRALRASVSIPGVFTPVKIRKDLYVDGGIVDPNPVDIVRAMGADIVISVDLHNQIDTKKGPKIKKNTFLKGLKDRFIAEELLMFENYIEPKRWPNFMKKMFEKGVNKIFYPAKILRVAGKREVPPIITVLLSSESVLAGQLSYLSSQTSNAEVKIVPVFENVNWQSFDHVEHMIALGEKAAKKELRKIRRLLA